uniref:Transposase (Putative), gypsy type n=1 Tax=Tanacetum cinerariifolium TaxID=118510 RepID=A0A699HM48_TANCI|nr:hypothetical protein [Tanacetum cinerariifolium]
MRVVIRHSGMMRIRVGVLCLRFLFVFVFVVVTDLFLLCTAIDLVAFIHHADPTKVKDVGNDDVNEGVNDVVKAGQAEQGDCVVDIEFIKIVVNDEIQAIITDQPNRIRMKRKATDGAGGSGFPHKNLKEDHGTSCDDGSSVTRKSLAALQGLFERSTLFAKVGVTATAIVPFFTSSMTPTPEHEGGGAEILTNVMDDEVTSIVRAVNPSIFRDSASPTTAEEDVASPFQPVGTDLSAGGFYISQAMDAETLRHVYIPKFFSQLQAMNYEQLLAEYSVGVDRQSCFSAEVRMRLEQELRGRQKLEERYAYQVDRLKEMNTEIASLKDQLSLKEVEAPEAICLRDQIAAVEAAEATRIMKLNSLKERNVSLEGKVATLELAVISKDAEIASFQSQIDSRSFWFTVSGLEVTCSGLHEEVMGYKLFKERVEEMQDEKIKVLSDRVAAIDSDLMEMVLHMDVEFYPCYLTTIAWWKWILSREPRLVLAKSGIEHGKVERGIADAVTFNPSAEGGYVDAINALRDVNFSLLVQLKANKDSSMVDIIDLLCLEGHVAKTSEASQLQPSPKQLMVPIHRLKDQMVIGETSLAFFLRGSTKSCSKG